MNIFNIFYIFFSLIFFGISFFINENLLDSLLLLIFIIISGYFISFSLKKGKYFENIEISKSLIWFSFLFLLPFYIVLFISTPIMSDNVELERVIFSNSLGIYNRFYPCIIYFIVCISFLSEWRNKWSPFLILFFMIISIFLTGFRSKAIDLFFIAALTYFLKNGHLHINKNSMKPIFNVTLISIIPIFIILFSITGLRSDLDNLAIIISIFERVFIINYETNIERIYLYVEAHGYYFGSSYLRDLLSIFSSNINSFQVDVTDYFSSRADYFVMTPTLYGESYANFGNYYFLAVLICIFYKFLLELVFAIFSIFLESKYIVPIFIVANYSFIRIIPTGGISNAFITKVVPALIILFIIIFLYKAIIEVQKEIIN